MKAYNLVIEVSQSNSGRLDVVIALKPNQRPLGWGFREGGSVKGVP